MTPTSPTLPVCPSAPPALPAPPALEREPWPEIDEIAAEAAVHVPADWNWYASVKTGLDYTIAILLLPVALALVALSVLAVKMTSPGPVFYTQTRLGLNGRRYKIIKIRTMHHNCEARTGIQWAQKNDNRITLVGRFLRFAHIDELPQLWNVLRGEMSLVGPRPERPEVIQAKGLEQHVPGYRHRLRVKPGVTGLAQVQLPADTDLTSVRHKVVYDLYYVQNQSLLLDLRVLLATVFKALLGPKWLRRVFLLPSRRKVTIAFQNQLAVAPQPQPDLQPA
jgi:lipopolysaccharide/colanic/teichoic acid biosynthesis glycosyltransferase